MTLSFSTKWPDRMGDLAGQPNYFIEKILKGLPDKKTYYPALCGNCGWKAMSSLFGCAAIADTGDTSIWCPKCQHETINDYAGVELINNGYYHQSSLREKLHTIREDKHDRWKPGIKIHPVINNRTKNRFQFAPVMECKSVQEIEITPTERYGFVRVDGRDLTTNEIIKLAINDGFPTIEDFFAYFNKDFTGKIIHWTDLRY